MARKFVKWIYPFLNSVLYEFPYYYIINHISMHFNRNNFVHKENPRSDLLNLLYSIIQILGRPNWRHGLVNEFSNSFCDKPRFWNIYAAH